MNSRERFEASMGLEEPDLVPVAPMVNVPHASKVLGVKPWEYVTDNHLYVKGQIAALKKYGYDWIFNHQPIQGVTKEEKESIRIQEGFVVLIHEMGSKIKIPLEGGPSIIEPVLKDYNELESLEIPDMDKKERMEPLIDLINQTNNEVYICSKVQAPFHYSAEWMRGMERFLLDLFVNPKEAKKLLAFMTEYAIEVGKRQIDVGTHGIMMEDPSAASQVISPKHYEEFAFPYEKRVCEELRRYGGEVIIHICGDTTPILEKLVKTRAKCLSLDETVDLKYAKEKVGDKVAIFGNVSVDTVFNGPVEKIQEEVKENIEKVGKKGYIVSTSCGLHANTPFEHVNALINAARKWG